MDFIEPLFSRVYNNMSFDILKNDSLKLVSSTVYNTIHRIM